jgi:hypothetical protein
MGVLSACMSGLEREAQDLQRQKQEITKQVHTRHDIAVTWVDRARDEVRFFTLIFVVFL